MSNKSVCAIAMIGVAMTSVVYLGCSQYDLSEVEVSETSQQESSIQEGEEKQDSGKQGCCGKCNLEGEDTKKSAETCAQCEEGSQSESNNKESCTEKCSACVDGDSENCKCVGDSKPLSSRNSDEKKQVNSIHQDRDIFHFLLENHEQIQRKVEVLDNGVRTTTESDNAKVAKKIQEHVASMHVRIETRSPVRMWDDLYREIFRHADKIQMEIKKTEKGIAVTETSEDAYVVELIKAHAKVVSKFAKHGFEEAHKNHEPPQKQDVENAK